MFFYTYKITLLKGSLSNKYYYGKHKTNNLDDGYCGSGRIIRNYYKKYGKINGETYVKEILHYYDNEQDLINAEIELIGNLYETDNNCLNLRAGGDKCGFSTKTRQLLSQHIKEHYESHPETRFHISKSIKEYYKTHDGPMKGKKHTDETKKKISEHLPDMTGCNNGFYGKHHTDDTKQLISNTNTGRIPWNKGIKMDLSEESRLKMRNAKIGKKLSEETRKKMSEARKKLGWYKDPITNKRIYYKLHDKI